IGRIAEYLTERWPNLFMADEAYIASSLCNLGKLVLALCRPDLADRFQAQIDDIHRLSRWTQAEQDYGGFHHTVLGEVGACFWGLSQSTVDVIQQHHMVANAHVHEHVQLHELAGIANQFTHWIKLQPHRMDPGLFQGLLRRFQLQPSDAELLARDMMHLAFVN
ncbi:MAG: HDOD domain-containing protein, partial [Proteobacteria bacterium]|nr:HDOD domain-containing protein [Pseudomonadota bacterium]